MTGVRLLSADLNEQPPRPEDTGSPWVPHLSSQPQQWTASRFLAWRDLVPEKLELLNGYIGDARELADMLAGLLEQTGVDAAVRIGDPHLWQSAVAGLSKAP